MLSGLPMSTIMNLPPLLRTRCTSEIASTNEKESRREYPHKTASNEDSLDAVLCGYSLRDSFSLVEAISEVHRVLKNGGRFIIVDIGKPDNVLLRSFVIC